MPKAGKQALITFLVLVPVGSVFGQSRQQPDRTSGMKTTKAANDGVQSAIEVLYRSGVISDRQFLPQDLATLPASFWPTGLSYDVRTDEVVYDGERLTVHEATKASDRAARSRGTTSTEVVYVEEKIIARLVFTTSMVSDNGDIILAGPNGSMQLSTSAGGRFVLMIRPPAENVDAFYPKAYFIEMAYLTDEGSVACCASPGTGGGYTTCKCDTANCGGGCDDTKCQGLKTCSGGCGSCAYTSCNECE